MCGTFVIILTRNKPSYYRGSYYRGRGRSRGRGVVVLHIIVPWDLYEALLLSAMARFVVRAIVIIFTIDPCDKATTCTVMYTPV